MFRPSATNSVHRPEFVKADGAWLEHRLRTGEVRAHTEDQMRRHTRRVNGEGMAELTSRGDSGEAKGRRRGEASEARPGRRPNAQGQARSLQWGEERLHRRWRIGRAHWDSAVGRKRQRWARGSRAGAGRHGCTAGKWREQGC
jgi:hypothetical protein